jgi:peptidoglycan glycosyltransferase
VNRSIHRLFLAVSAGFVLLIVLLGYWQVVDASSLADHVGNRQAAQRERLVDRGRIISADGVVLADSRKVVEHGQEVYVRVYPHGALAPHVVGYTGSTRTGLEDTWNRYLAGSYGTEPLLERLRLKTKQGADLHITLDSRVQQAAVDGLAASGHAGAVVALDPRTGGVLAMASAPGFNLEDVANPAAFKRILSESGSPLLDRATQGLYPPGSTFKVVTATAALESGDFTPQTGFNDTGTLVVHGLRINNFGGERFGRHTLSDALTHSINTTFAKIGTVLGAKRLGDTMTAYGFGIRPPIDLPEDQVAVSGRLQGSKVLPNDDPDMDVARVAIGQERLNVTPLQMAMVAAAIADGGEMHAPYLLRTVTDHGGSTVFAQAPRPLGTATTPQVASELTAMMQRVVEEGTGTRAALAGLSVAGKTGTAETGQAGRNQAWFIGFAPAQAPTVAVAVLIEDSPSTGGVVAAPVAASVMKAAIAAGE